MTFESDYTEGACPQVLEHLVRTNGEQLGGYGADKYCESARKKIAAACGIPDAQITFISGGTQTNQIVIDALLRPYEGVVSAQTGHVAQHEAGAIEYTGHKVLTVPSHEGKIQAPELSRFISDFYADTNHEHMVFPGMVYVSFPTEYGTLYTKKELSEIHEVCAANDIPLYIDGARLGYALASPACGMTLHDIAALCDVFYIGGTKVGALCGEAVVFTKGNEPCHFQNFVKKHGALLAKGRLLGVQFDALFTDGTYLGISRHAIDMAMLLKEGLRSAGYKTLLDSPTNQQFFVIENAKLPALRKQVGFSFWEKHDETHSVIRFATSWATKKEDVERLIEIMRTLISG